MPLAFVDRVVVAVLEAMVGLVGTVVAVDMVVAADMGWAVRTGLAEHTVVRMAEVASERFQRPMLRRPQSSTPSILSELP
jgi:hypothetical protein